MMLTESKTASLISQNLLAMLKESHDLFRLIKCF